MAKIKRKKQNNEKIGHLKAHVVTIEVENPYFQKSDKESRTNQNTIKVHVNANESAIETLYSRGSIDLAHKLADDKLRYLWEACGGKGASAIDYSREQVDGRATITCVTDK